MNVTVADLGVGNLHSLTKALIACGAKPTVETRPEAWLDADVLVLPGVGAFGAGAAALAPVREPLRQRLEAGTPCLGICLGLQLMFQGSEETPAAAGLGLLKGTVRRFPDALGVKVPHMGWTRIQGTADPLMEGIDPGQNFYFVHSYYPPSEGNHVVATARHGTEFPCILRKGATVGVQFHPEKSSDAGLQLLKNWVRLVEAQV